MNEKVPLDQDLELDASDEKAGVMTKAELVDEVARVVQLTKKQAETIVNIVFDSIVDSLRSGQKIELRGFGSFRLRNRKSRTGRNPKTGEKVEVPSKKIPYFKPGKELKELINQTVTAQPAEGAEGHDGPSTPDQS
ncbi:MAG: integration host factor subunit beta [Thermoanaerobaculia bacterium]